MDEVSGNAQGISNEPQLQQLSTTPDLTLDVLYVIFSYLVYKDLYNMQFVNKLWHKAVHAAQLWSNYVFEVKYGMPLKSVLFKVRHLRAIQNIKCSYILPKQDAITILTEMLRHMKRLKVIHFYGGVPALYARKIARKYKNLESLTLNFYADDIVESLRFLRSCEKLTELVFTGIIGHKISSEKLAKIIVRIAEAMNLVATGFPHLQNLDLRGTLTHAIKIDDDLYKTVLIAKSSQLLSLKFTFNATVHADVLKEIDNCTNLEHLLLNVKFPRLPCVFPNLTNLKTLVLEFHVTEPDTLDYALENSFKLSEMPNLRSLKVCVHKAQAEKKRFLKKLINEASQLEELEFINVNLDCLSKDLKHISNLSNLRLLSLRKCFTADDNDIKNISFCKSLQCLKIGCSNLATAAIDYLADCTTLRSLLFTECRFEEEIITYLMRKLHFLNLLSLSFDYNHSVNIESVNHIRDEVHPNLKLHII